MLRYGRRLAVDENRSAPFGGSGRGEADFAVSQYGTWGIDDVDLYESPDRVWYAIEVEDPQSEREATVRILEDGTLL